MNVTGSIAVVLALGTMAGGLWGCGPRQAIERSGAHTGRAVPIGADVASLPLDALARAVADAGVELGAEASGEVGEGQSSGDPIAADTASDASPGEREDGAAMVDALDTLEVPPPPPAATAPARSVTPGLLQVSWSDPPAATDLTTLGRLDWVHWGHQQRSALNRKGGVPTRIQAAKLGQRPVGDYDDRPPRVTWSDGTPTLAAQTSEGIDTGGETGAGFLVRVPGPLPGSNRLTVLLGVWNARGQLEVRIEGQPALAPQERLLEAEHPGRDRATVIDFGPLEAGQTLLVRWTVAALEDQFGNVTLQAAALSSLLAP